MKNDLVFVSYVFTDSDSLGQGFGDMGVEYPGPIHTYSDIKKLSELVKAKDPKSDNVVIMSWRRFEDDGYPTGNPTHSGGRP